jgi:RimJ/RimL family protein N-acetyltransferase
VAERFFTPDYVERCELRDGTRVLLRLLTPEDRHALRAGFEALSPESRYARFLAPKNTLTDAELDYLCNIDQENHFALGAVVEDGDGKGGVIGAGIARFIRIHDEHATAEAAIAVADAMQGRGLGKLLFMRLCAAAEERGIERFACEVLGSNNSMAGLIERISPDREIVVSQGVMKIDMPLPNVTPTQPPASLPPDSGLYALLRMAAENAIEWTEAVRKLWRRE